jgi:phosphoglucosamine mutase
VSATAWPPALEAYDAATLAGVVVATVLMMTEFTKVGAVLVESGKPMSELARQFDPVPQLLQNVRFTSGKPLEDTKVKAAIKEGEATLNGQGRLLVRPSGTEKLIRVMAEGDDAALVKRVVADVAAAVKAAG